METTSSTDIRVSFASQFNQSHFNDAIVEFVVQNDLPFRVVDSKYFHKLVSIANRSAIVRKRASLKQSLICMFNAKREQLVVELQKIDSKLSFTLDLWTSPNQISFLGITFHYISNDWNLVTKTIAFKEILDAHTGVNLAKSFNQIIQYYGIDSKICGITIDNAANNQTFIAELVPLHNFNKEMHFRCFGHVLNLAVQSTMVYMKPLLENLRRYIRRIRYSSKHTNRLKQLCIQMEPPIQFLKPRLDVATRWNSTYVMLERALHLKQPKKIIICENRWESEISEISAND